MAGLKTSQIRQAYSALRKKFHSVVDLAHLRVTDAHGGVGFDIRNDAKGGAHVQARLYLQNWPWRVNSSKNNLDILVRVDESFSADSPKVMSSATRVSYFLVRGSFATPMLHIHYDFIDPVQQAHPVFHAQLGQVDWTNSELAELGFVHRVKRGELNNFRNHRIPTAFMGYGPILLAFAADHLPHLYYTDFLSELRKNTSCTWGASCDSLQKSLGKQGGYLHSHHWY